MCDVTIGRAAAGPAVFDRPGGMAAFADAHEFTLADLEENRRGVVTDSQKLAIRLRASFDIVIAVPVCGLLLTLFSFLSYGLLQVQGRPAARAIGACFLCAALLVSYIGASVVHASVRSLRAAREGRVFSTDGVFKVIARSSKNCSVSYFYRVGEHTFHIWSAGRHFTVTHGCEGAAFRFYYLEGENLLSLEPIPVRKCDAPEPGAGA